MKLRINESTMRFRLSQTEVKQVASGVSVQGTVYFGKENIFRYSINPEEVNDIGADYNNNSIKVSVPRKEIKEWAEDDTTVGIDHSIQHEQGTSLFILIEKDFKCRTEREGENEKDLFENPQEKHNC